MLGFEIKCAVFYELHMQVLWHCACLTSITGTEYSELLDWRDEVQMCSEEVHKCSRINHKHEHAKTIQPHLLPVKNMQKNVYTLRKFKTSFFSTEHTRFSCITRLGANQETLYLHYTQTSENFTSQME